MAFLGSCKILFNVINLKYVFSSQGKEGDNVNCNALNQ